MLLTNQSSAHLSQSESAIYLEIELIQVGQELGDGADTLVSHVDTVSQGEADQARMEAGPEALLSDLVTSINF